MTVVALSRAPGRRPPFSMPALRPCPAVLYESGAPLALRDAVWRREIHGHGHARRLKRACLGCATAWFGLILMLSI